LNAASSSAVKSSRVTVQCLQRGVDLISSSVFDFCLALKYGG
jgi:hypothetical protein